jgi:6-phosphogluconolactonase (cycloisomerase 2 family)
MMASTTRATFVYVGNAESNEIYVMQLDRQNGDLTVVEKVLIPGIIKPGTSTPMAVSFDRRFLYVGFAIIKDYSPEHGREHERFELEGCVAD